MRSIEEIFDHLKSENIKIWREGDNLRYRAPKGGLVQELREELVNRKEELISSMPIFDAAPEIVEDKLHRFDAFPLTEIQEAYWVGRSGAFNLGDIGVHGYLEIENNFDMERLIDSWNHVIQRHEMLRAVVTPNGEQKILKDVPFYTIELTDMRNASSEETQKHLEQVSNELSHQVLPADKWPLFEIRATQLKDDNFILHVSLDLLMADLWSLFIVFHDWAEFLGDADYAPSPLEVSFRDYVLAERAYRKTDAYQRAEKYWYDRVDSLPLGPDLPLVKPIEMLHRPRFKRYASKLNAQAWQELKDKAKSHGLTSSGVLFAAYSEVLGRWSKTAEFNLNVTLFNRLPVHPQINQIVGDFTTTVLLAVNHSKRETFVERGKRLQQQLWHDLDNRSVNAVQVIREMARRRGGLNRAAMPVVFSSALGVDSLDEGSPSLGRFGSQLGKVLRTISQTPQVWIDHQAVEQEGELLFNWDGIEELFPDDMLADMFTSYCELLERLSSDDAEWQNYQRKLLPDAQIKQQELANATDADLSELLLHELFLRQCSEQGQNVAVISNRKTLSYEDLESHSTQIAHRLRNLGVQPNTLVAVVMEKGWEQVVAVLGIFMSGAAYVPIDPDLPEERRLQLFKDAEIKIALTQSWINERLVWPESINHLCVDDSEVWKEESLDPLQSVQSTQDLAYIIYTSGSTGNPKGVMIDHRGVVNTILDINERYAIGKNDRVLALSALSFDLSVYDIFGLLAAGGAIVLTDTHENKDAASWARLMSEHRVSVWNTVPALLQMLVEYNGSRNVKQNDAFKIAMLSGDWIPVSLPEKVKALWPDLQLVSQGGATEASIWSIFYPINKIDPLWKSVPYGKPLKNQSYLVLNEAMEPCPVWVPGHLYIGGVGLAKGYWKDEVKTRASFITHPDTKERLYKTGDMGCYWPDGNIEFLGREDFQVKVNGYRIELGEIEAAIMQHPDVKESVVTTSGGKYEAKRLVAYIVSEVKKENTPVPSPEALNAPVQGMSSLEKLAFKLEQKSVRHFEPEQVCVKLSKPEFDDELRASYLKHRAYRQYLTAPVEFERFSAFMSSLLQMPIKESPLPKYRFPSAGSLYPIQTYLYIKPGRVEGVAGGVYYYHPAEHDLVQLSSSDEIDERVRRAHGGPNGAIFDQSAFALFSIAELNAIEPIYGEWAKDFCYLEAGYIGQLLMDKAPDFEIGLCPIGKLDFDELRSIFDWQPSQIFVQGFLGGAVLPEQIQELNFAQPNTEVHVPVEDLAEFLQKKLPKHMVPLNFIYLESIPLNNNGKLDRKALPKLDLAAQQKKKAPPKLPSSDLEKKIAALVAQVLEIDLVGMNDNLFDLGADSVSIVRLNNILTEQFAKEIPIVEMFQYPTVNYLAKFIKKTDKSTGTTESAQKRAQQIRQARKRRADA